MFPKHDIDPKEKNSEWHYKMAEACFRDFTESNARIFYNVRERYDEIKTYILGKQPIDKYKKQLLGGESTDESWVNIDWTPRPVAAKLRDIAVNKVIQRMFNIICTPLDVSAKNETEEYYAKQKAKILVRKALNKQAPGIDTPLLEKGADEPADLDELEMMMDLGVKLKVAMEAEMGIDYVFHRNNYKSARLEANMSSFDFGVGGYKEYVDENGEVKIREVDITRVITSWCMKRDFSDAWYVGEVCQVNVNDLPFSEEEKTKIYSLVGDKSGLWDRKNHTVNVLDLEFLTWNDRVYEQRENKDGNLVQRRASFNKKNSDKKVIIGGKEEDKYINKPIQMAHKVKWVIGTDKVYDFGPCTYQKRTKENKALTSLGYHLFAYNFYAMTASGIMERLIPIIDEYHTTIYKIQNFKNKWVPYIINIDIQAMENVALGSGGAQLTPKEILQLVFQNFTALGRRMDVSGQLQNYKMVDIEPTGMSQEYTVLAGDLARLLAEMREVTGLNELTDGSTPGERTLNYVASLGEQSTNLALSPLFLSDKTLTERVAKSVIYRLVKTIQEKEIEGYTRTFGDESVKFIKVTKDISDRVWDIKIEDRPTDAQKEALIQQMEMKEAQGLIQPDDKILIIETNNLKQARTLLAFRIKKRREEAQAYELQKMQMNGQVQQESAMLAEKAKQETLALEYQLKKDLELSKLEKEKELLMMKLEVDLQKAEAVAGTKLVSQQLANEQKTSVTEK